MAEELNYIEFLRTCGDCGTDTKVRLWFAKKATLWGKTMIIPETICVVCKAGMPAYARTFLELGEVKSAVPDEALVSPKEEKPDA